MQCHLYVFVFFILILELALQDGKMGNENFTKELRSLVGDAMLRSILRGVHGRE